MTAIPIPATDVTLQAGVTYQAQATTVLTYKPATGATGWSGKAIVSYLGPIS